MTGILERLRRQIVDLLHDLASRPLSLFCLLLAANAVALPYGNFYHDANLYGVQVLNRVYPGHFAGDLYFQYGSQDKYSVFSRAAAPVVARLGLPLGFFVLYFASNALFLFALQRFVRAVVKDPIVSTLALLFLAVTEIPFGGLRIFHVNEPFLTPRILANALVLFGLERLIAGRSAQALALTLLALPLHPLMAFPGVLIVVGWLALTHLRTKTLLVVLCLAALAVVATLLDQPLALRLFGLMDDAWRDSVHRVAPYLFPLEWTADDWLRIVLSFVVVLEAAHYFRGNAAVRCLLIAMSAAAALGLAGGVLACFLPYALPLQGQAYRWLWPLELSLYPLGLLAAYRLGRAKGVFGPLAALGLLAYLNKSAWDNPVLLFCLLVAALFGSLYWRGLSARPRQEDWAAWAGGLALAVAILLWTAIKLAAIAALWPRFNALLEPIDYLYLLTGLIDPLCWLALVVLAAALLAKVVGLDQRIRLACLGCCVGAWLVFFVFPQSQFYSKHWARYAAKERFVAEYLARYPTPGTTPTIYWPGGKIELVWFALRANNYFEWPHQIVGNLFSAETAREGARRSQLVKKFELERLRKEQILHTPRTMTWCLAIYQATENEPVPEAGDLRELCRDKRLDFVVLPQEFPGLYAASNGRFFLYDCRTIRAGLEGPPARAETPRLSTARSNPQEAATH